MSSRFSADFVRDIIAAVPTGKANAIDAASINEAVGYNTKVTTRQALAKLVALGRVTRIDNPSRLKCRSAFLYYRDDADEFESAMAVYGEPALERRPRG